MEKVSTSTNFCSRGINRSSLEKELENEIRVHVGRKVTISTKKFFFSQKLLVDFSVDSNSNSVHVNHFFEPSLLLLICKSQLNSLLFSIVFPPIAMRHVNSSMAAIVG